MKFAVLPADLQSELELARIEGRGGLACSGEERIHVRHIEAIDDVEHVHRGIEVDALACEVEPAADAYVVEENERPRGRVAAQVTVAVCVPDAVKNAIEDA